ncbi:MAG: hypothetical protein KatS3mg096_191 [Candidatus Parcubacteria bacterium]|nr:MAG: hypothetical protein KatS3mg096_191 [Candidatus Parcubacteria bacterium]
MVKGFEELIVFQKARDLTKLIYNLTKKEEFKKDFGLVDHIRRASVSIISNIAEGFERGTKEELPHFLYIAKASCGEVRAQIKVSGFKGLKYKKVKPKDVEEFDRMLEKILAKRQTLII